MLAALSQSPVLAVFLVIFLVLIELDKYLTKPFKFVPGTRMTFPGLKKAQERGYLIEGLANIRGNRFRRRSMQEGGTSSPKR
jgi:hypothetical protein